MKTKICELLAAVVAFGTGIAFSENAAEIGSARLKGYLGERLDAMIERHVGGADVDYITASFLEKTETKGWWQTGFWGKCAACCGGDPAGGLERATKSRI